MKSRISSYLWHMVPVLVFSIFLSVSGCGSFSYADGQLDTAEKIMDSSPDSALSILDSNVGELRGKKQKARYALLKSMALDKNYVDTTTFEILQPAIDYYLQKGTPDEKLRTYYYQGRIFQNRNERDSALQSFIRGLDVASDCRDSLTIARTLVLLGILYKGFYDYEQYTDNYLSAAKIFRNQHNISYEFECLLNALNGAVILRRMKQADSIISILDKFDSLDKAQIQSLNEQRITYTLHFGSKHDLRNLVESNKNNFNYNTNGILNLARAYNRLGDNNKAISQLDYLDNVGAKYDTLKYLSIRYSILEDMKNYEEALIVYENFIDRLDAINSAKFDQKSRSMEEKHMMELQIEREAERTRKTILCGIGVLVFLAMATVMLTLQMRRNRIKKDLALQKARNAELENENLKAENELANQKARTAELENENLKAENELVLQKARTAELENENLKTEKEKLALENRNLQLERDNKALEAENLTHRVKELEGESENFKELLESQKEMPEEVRKAIQTRIEMLNSYLASQISDHKEFEKAYDTWVAELTANTQEFMDSNRLAFQASHPAFIKYFEDHGLTESEINYVCLYAIGLRGKDVGNYMKMRSHVNISSAIRKKLGIDKHDTNIGIYVRKLLKDV